MDKRQRGKEHYNWRGGKPLCPDCGKQLSSRKSFRCKPCSLKYQKGTNSPWVVSATDLDIRDLTATDIVSVNMRAYRSSDTSYQPIRLDKATNTLQTIDYEHHEIHSGSHYFYYDYDSDVDTAAPKYYRLTTPNTTAWIHILFTLYSEGIGTWQLFENPTVNAAGTTATTFNSDRNSGNTAGQYVEFFYHADSANARILAVAAGANPTRPACPSVIVTFNRISD